LLMEKTFEQVLILSWSEKLLSTENFTNLVQNWKPQYIFFTLDDKDINSRTLEHYPSSGVFKADGILQHNVVKEIVSITDLKRIGSDKFRITGGDPFFEFVLVKDAPISSLKLLNVNISCSNLQMKVKLPLQLFWSSPGKAFSEENSFRFEINQNGQSLNLQSIDNWNKSGPIEKVRLDVDAPNCNEFSLSKFLLGN